MKVAADRNPSDRHFALLRAAPGHCFDIPPVILDAHLFWIFCVGRSLQPPPHPPGRAGFMRL